MRDFEKYIGAKYPNRSPKILFQKFKDIDGDLFYGVKEIEDQAEVWNHQQAIINVLKAQLECCRKENAVLLGKVGEGEKRVSELNQWNDNQYELIKRNESHTQSLRHLLQKLIDDDYTTMRPSMAYEIQEILRGANEDT